MPRSTRAEFNRRVDEVLALRIDGAQIADLVRYAAENGWGVCPRMVQRYIRAADTLLVARLERRRRRVLTRHIAGRQALYARSLNAGDYRGALAVLADEAKLLGLYPSR